MAKKLSTQEILAAARAQVSGGSKSSPSDSSDQPEKSAETTSEESAAETPDETPTAEPDSSGAQSEPPPAETDSPAVPSTPKSTADILAAARAQAAGKKQSASPPPGESPKTDAPKSAAPPSAAPTSTKDILAAARAQAKGGTASSSPKPQPKEGKPKQKPTVDSPTSEQKTSTTGGPRPSVEEMLKTVREGRPRAATEKPEAAQPKPIRKPVAARKSGQADSGGGRRGALLAILLSPFALAWLFFTAASGAFILGLARFSMPNVLVEPPSRFKVGPPSDYPFGMVSTKWKDQFGVWLVHTNYTGRNVIYALRSVCTHLGCTPNWLEGEQKFKCPCHGSGFYISGINFEGPAPRPLERVGISLGADGMLEVDKSVKFQEELGQWEHVDSYVEVA